MNQRRLPRLPNRRRCRARARRDALVVTASVLLLGGAARSAAQSGSSGQLTIEYIAHASFRLVSPAGTALVIDPYASRVWLGYDFPEPLEEPTVLITHPHYDHDGGRYRGLDVPWGPETHVIDAPGIKVVGDIVIHGIEGKHADPYGKEFGQLNTIFVLETAGVRVAHVGDNGRLTPDNVEAMGRIDILMIPIDAVFHILSEDAVEAAIAAVRPRVVVPMHYRIPELETDPDSPADLGPIDPWLEGRDGVVRLETNRYVVSDTELPDAPRILVFRHSPAVRAVPGGGS